MENIVGESIAPDFKLSLPGLLRRNLTAIRPVQRRLWPIFYRQLIERKRRIVLRFHIEDLAVSLASRLTAAWKEIGLQKKGGVSRIFLRSCLNEVIPLNFP